MRTTRSRRAGDVLGDDHSPDLEALVATARPLAEDAPLPFHMGNGNCLRADAPAGTLITAEMVEPPADSTLWMLRRQQDQHFFAETPHHA
jgi:predicted homoserine dehydrogenase-like protein